MQEPGGRIEAELWRSTIVNDLLSMLSQAIQAHLSKGGTPPPLSVLGPPTSIINQEKAILMEVFSQLEPFFPDN